MLTGKRVLLIIGGGIAAFKSLDLIRRLRERGNTVVPVLTAAAEKFVTPLSVSALAAERVHRDLFDLTGEVEMGHIELSRSADLIAVAPCTADLMAKMAGGHADDLASTLLMATDKPVLIAPSMNVRMWLHPATQRNLTTLRSERILVVGPEEGEMACGEFGPGRMSETTDIINAMVPALGDGPLRGRHVLVTSGPTIESIDPVRYITNRSSGAQGAAIAEALVSLGARVTFVTGPSSVPQPIGVEAVRVESAAQMLDAVEAALPADAAVFAAAVADWRSAKESSRKIKKDGSGGPPKFELMENPDILATIALKRDGRPELVVGFAAETDDVIAQAVAKRERKGCDWILANDVSPETGIVGGSENAVTLISSDGVEEWPRMGKTQVAARLANRIAETLA
ncbi:MAG: bifunctional phosphopantothenoylcysteine decarboxylase/phosphopantothenate--cysteine ligase CoaBC [Rhodobacter sp.]|nr:bifunctional phosphopantothenoylcysteine decarboxylase/phosphopantothenate--cysteine ligase CoaBC [Rhodobacter sp.]MCY4169597.1 bifunctional phosphopantothenoylcysteine decarboxylase/phosphopantothenate--cysteine ligase CoaBC [Rhodobacter sp.]MCY4243708.1 bifunctional phosphopantothenoylcysteine decarboxylase/phosphopantothenate--cysteine ligase CoaBC [Rhodobacter sp.]